MLGLEDNFPIWHKMEGLAKSLGVARWLFVYCGWQREQSEFPDLAHVEEVVEWSEGDLYFPPTKTELWILGSRLYLN